MLPSKSCKTINANFLLKNFGLTFFDRFRTGTYLVNWFGRGSADRTWRFGGLAEPCWTSKFGRYRCRCRFIGRSLILGAFGKESSAVAPLCEQAPHQSCHLMLLGYSAWSLVTKWLQLVLATQIGYMLQWSQRKRGKKSILSHVLSINETYCKIVLVLS